MYGQDLPPSESLPDRNAMERQLNKTIPGPLNMKMNGWRESDVYLATSWLKAIYRYVRSLQGDRHHRFNLPLADERQVLVAIANRLELDVPTLLAADPDEEVRIIYDAVRELTAECDDPLTCLG